MSVFVAAVGVCVQSESGDMRTASSDVQQLHTLLEFRQDTEGYVALTKAEQDMGRKKSGLHVVKKYNR